MPFRIRGSSEQATYTGNKTITGTLTVTGQIIGSASQTGSAPAFSITGDLDTGWWNNGNNGWTFSKDSNQILTIDGGGIQFTNVRSLNWSQGSAYDTTDLSLFRDAADRLGQRRGTNAQGFSVYNTFTDVNSYERSEFTWSTNILFVGTNFGGSGVARALNFMTAGIGRWQVSATGHFLGVTDNTYDIGASGANRPRNLFLSGNLNIGTTTVLESDAADILAQRRGVNAQTFRIYETFTDSSNYKRLNLSASQISQGVAGTGVAGTLQVGTIGASNLDFFTNNQIRIRIDPNGTMLFVTDNSQDIGASGATRPRNVYIASLLTLSGGTLLATSAALTNGAAAQVATLTNGPTAGNPTKWVPINDNGTTRYIPAW